MIAAWLLTLSTALAGGPCEQAADGFPVGPVLAPLADGALGTPKRTCVRSELGLGADARLTADTANFYGYIVAGVVIDGSYAVHPEVEVTGRLEAFRLDLGIASLSATSMGLGHLTAGAAWARDLSDVVAIGVRGSVVLPTATPLYQVGRPFAGEVALTSVQQPHRMVRVHEGVSGLIVGGVGGPVALAGGLTVNAGVEVRPTKVFGLVVDVDAGLFRTATFDHLAVGGGLRFSDGRRFGFEFGVRAPLAGRERALLTTELKGTVRFGKVGER
jgi:hypothetical protein